MIEAKFEDVVVCATTTTDAVRQITVELYPQDTVVEVVDFQGAEYEISLLKGINNLLMMLHALKIDNTSVRFIKCGRKLSSRDMNKILEFVKEF